MAISADVAGLDVYADPAKERLGTSANIVTYLRTLGAVVLAGLAVREDSLPLLVAALVVYWLGDMLDGFIARVRGCETRMGAVLDILCDRFCAASFYLGLAWLSPEFVLPVFIYLAEFMVVDCFLSLAFLAWPVRSPNYFYVVDRPLWQWNWSKPGKAVNSSLFAVLLLVTGWVWLGVVIATALFVLKTVSLVRLARIGLPIPTQPSSVS
ncbi:MAG TPA: CDP-alcohol phosphatidyltransferase family protein [Marmoricola sp.]|nr:CDP-alcohol phosphatidyltransferase family protein [Marmoricola sp.]